MTRISISVNPIATGLPAFQIFSTKQDPALQNKISKKILDLAGNYFRNMEIPDFDSALCSATVFEVFLLQLNKTRSLCQKLWFTWHYVVISSVCPSFFQLFLAVSATFPMKCPCWMKFCKTAVYYLLFFFTFVFKMVSVSSCSKRRSRNCCALLAEECQPHHPHRKRKYCLEHDTIRFPGVEKFINIGHYLQFSFFFSFLLSFFFSFVFSCLFCFFVWWLVLGFLFCFFLLVCLFVCLL